MSSAPSVIHVYGDVLDRLLHASGESTSQWNQPFDPSPILPDLPSDLTADLTADQITKIKEEIADARLHILIGIFTIIFRNGYHPQRVCRNVYKLAKLYCPESIKHLSHSDLAILTSDTSSASSMRTRACNTYIDTLTHQQAQKIIDTYGPNALHKLAQVSWQPKNKHRKKHRRKKHTTPATPKQPQLNLPL